MTLLLLACGGDTSLVGEGHNDAPQVSLESPSEGTQIFLGEALILQATATDPDGDDEAIRLIFSSSLEGPTEGLLTRPGRHTLVVLAVDDEGGTDVDGVGVTVIDPDRDGDGYWATAWGGEDCRDDHPGIHPGVEDACDGADQDCDGVVDEDALVLTWYRDADLDGFGDPRETLETCFFPEGWSQDDSDCHDEDASFRHCSSCEELQGSVFDEGDGVYLIEPEPEARFEVYCNHTDYDGGWTLLGTTVGDDYEWSPLDILAEEPFGDVHQEDEGFKSPAWSLMPFTDLLFVGPTMDAHYDFVGDGQSSFYDFLLRSPFNNCGSSSDTYVMFQGTFEHSSLCNTRLYIHPQDLDGSSTCVEGSARSHISTPAVGPAWSRVTNHGCPLDDPVSASLWRTGPWGYPLRMYGR